MMPLYSEDHKKFIKSLPCSVAACRSRFTIPAHTPGLGGARGMKQKRSDFETIPLCNSHHDEQHNIGWKDFAAKYDLNVPELLAVLNVKPHLTKGADERYWMAFQGDTYVLTRIENGPKKAILLAQEFRRDWLIENVFRPKRAA
jgi:hypothetical protein